MKSSPLARRQLRNHARYRGRNDLNIVPMLDVMVILAFFLIFTAVFSKTSVLEVNLPGPGAQAASTVPVFELEVIVRRGAVEIADRNQGVLETVPATATGQDVVRAVRVPRRAQGAFPRPAECNVARRRGRGLRHDRAGHGCGPRPPEHGRRQGRAP